MGFFGKVWNGVKKVGKRIGKGVKGAASGAQSGGIFGAAGGLVNGLIGGKKEDKTGTGGIGKGANGNNSLGGLNLAKMQGLGGLNMAPIQGTGSGKIGDYEISVGSEEEKENKPQWFKLLGVSAAGITIFSTLFGRR